MIGVDDLLDICNDALTRTHDDPVTIALVEARPAGDRAYSETEGGVAQEYEIAGVGRFRVSVEEL